MKKSVLVGAATLAAATPLLVLAFAPAPDAASRAVEYKTWKGYAEARDSGLKGDASFVALTSKTEFFRVFSPVLTPRGAPDAIPKDAFDKQLFVAVIKRDSAFWDYKVEKVTANGETLTVHYRATERKGESTSRGETRKAEPFVGTAKAIGTAKAATTEKAPAETREPTPNDYKKKMEERGQVPTGDTKREDAQTARTRGPAAIVDSSLILSVGKDKYRSVVFMENGKKVGTARVDN
jgi:hypothetical protein